MLGFEAGVGGGRRNMQVHRSRQCSGCVSYRSRFACNRAKRGRDDGSGGYGNDGYSTVGIVIGGRGRLSIGLVDERAAFKVDNVAEQRSGLPVAGFVVVEEHFPNLPGPSLVSRYQTYSVNLVDNILETLVG